MSINKEHTEILDHYSAECPICKGVLLPERVAELENANDILAAKLALAEGGAVEYQVNVATTVPSVTYEDLQAEVEDLKKALVSSQTKLDTWRDLYQAASGMAMKHQETGLEYRNWNQPDWK